MKFFHIFTLLVVLTTLSIVGCDEGMNMVKPVLPGSETQEPETPEIPTTIGEIKVPEPETSAEIAYYRDIELTRPATGSVEIGTTLYIQVTFSEEVPVVIADDESARPSIFLTVKPDPEATRQKTRTTQYHMKPQGAELESGDAVPYQGTFLCKYVVGTEDFGRNLLTHTKTSEGTELRVILFSEWRSGDKHSPIIQENPNDFVGFVCAAYEHRIANAVVTIMAGPRSGEQVITEQSGQYTFPNVDVDELHLHVEKEYFEPKEVIVYRDHQTILANGNKPNFLRRPKTPGRIQIGQRWPDEIRSILENTLVVYDLLYYTDLTPIENISSSGSYTGSFGHIEIHAEHIGRHNDPTGVLLHVLAHEIAHAHQHALISIDGSARNLGSDWDNTSEGKAFAEARQKDWDSFGKILEIDTIPHYLWLDENAAEVSAYYWINSQRTQYKGPKLETVAPHRLAWAEEWLGGK